jgi:ADP-ribose pyrophosphatase YjhB (NUDIX family)
VIFQLSMALGALAAGVRFVVKPASERRRPVAGAVVINFRHELALVLRRDRQQQLYWSLPKVYVATGEELEAAALRGVHAATGMGARVRRPLLVHRGLCHDTHYFEAIVERDDGPPTHDDAPLYCFFTLPDALLRIRSPRDRAVLGRLLALRSEEFVDLGG